MSATSSFVGKAIAQKVSVKSTKASTTVRASAVNKVRVARALDDARMTLSRADTRDLPARRERTNVAPSRVARAVRSRDRRLTVTAYLHRCDRRARVAPPRVASPTVRRAQDPRDRGSVDRSKSRGVVRTHRIRIRTRDDDDDERCETRDARCGRRRAPSIAPRVHTFRTRTGCLRRRRDRGHLVHHRPGLRLGEHRIDGQAPREPNRTSIDLRGG